MDSLNGRNLSVVRMVTGSHVDGVGNLGPLLELKKTATKLNIELIKVVGGVLLVARPGKETIEAFIPDANILSVTFEP